MSVLGMFSPQEFARLVERFPVTDDPLFFPVWRQKIFEAGREVQSLVRQREFLRDAGKLTSVGISEEIQALADRSLRPRLAALEDALEAMNAATVRLRAKASALPTIDKTDVNAAQKRAEIRALLRAMPPHDRVTLALQATDEDVVQAILDAPEVLTGLSREIRQEVIEARINRTMAPDDRANLEAVEQARELAAAVRDGLRAAMSEFVPTEVGSVAEGAEVATAGL